MYAHASAPCRIGIAGGGTDLPAWTKERAGRCLSLAINTYTHAFAISRRDGLVVASYAGRDVARCATEIGNGLVRESALLHGFEDGFEVHTTSEVTSKGSGLGVSSSFAVSLAACFSRMRELNRRSKPPFSKQALGSGIDWGVSVTARDAWTVEIDRLKRPIGRQDHMAAAHGGLRLYAFEGDDARVEHTFTEDDAVWIARHLVLLPLVDGHDSRTILSGVNKASTLQVAYDAVDVAVTAIQDRSVDLLGRALLMGQESKEAIAGAVPLAVARIVIQAAHAQGVTGCKVAGAGGGGHLVIAVEDDDAVAALYRATQIEPVQVAPDLHGVRSEGSL